MSTELSQYCQDKMKNGAKSFTFASVFFGQEMKTSVMYLYAWCRYCDDQIDDAPDLETARKNLADLIVKTKSVYLEGHGPIEPEFKALQFVVKKYKIPQHYVIELLEGMRMDNDGTTYRNLGDLKLYCYRVAGVVGGMMAHILGISDEKALRHAIDLGIAFQLSNISRDVSDDWKLGRIYLPQDWLAEKNIDPRDFGNPKFRQPIYEIVDRLVAEADIYYDSAYRGLRYLPLFGAFSISAAGEIYSAIGHTVCDRGVQAWESRTVIPNWKKTLLLIKSLARVILQIPSRLLGPHRSIEKISRVEFFDVKI